ncbi:erfK/srfK [Brucella endophytica]|uniref:ErfK/srfK n=1 Tax=Brucella endophytica TaxID=1963359 RepID=A0A916SNX4_9HYPH|nr:L,D-transpeptidase [Brucella endophytica]GGB05816.1 erfK/srfK [Brucella endophytica]
MLKFNARWLFLIVMLIAIPATQVQAQPAGAPVFDESYIDFLYSPTRPAPAPSTPHATNKNADRGTRQRIAYQSAEPVGTILIDTTARRLYLIEAGGFAQTYKVGVGREGYGWRGTERISAKKHWPDWRPPADMLARRPDLPRYMAGGPENPLGARALYLGGTLYRIHGSNEPETVGEAASSGCFRMTNTDIIDLYERVNVGAKVRVF